MKVQGRTLCETVIGEPYQPVRIYYRVLKKGALLGRFKRLKCIQPEGKGNRWNWLYLGEAREIAYDTPYTEIPKEYRPVQLGYFEWRSSEELHLNVYSLQGVVKALEFFNRKINRHLMSPEKLRMVNQCFDESDTLSTNRPHPSFDEFFDSDDVFIPAPKQFKERIAQIEAEYEDPKDRSEALDKFMREDNQKVSPLVEEIPFHLEDENWTTMLSLSLMLKQIEAIEHWKGNKSFTQQEAIEQLLEMTENIWDREG